MLDVDLVRLDEDLPLPRRAHPDDAGVDLLARADLTLPPGRRALVGTGVAVALPEGYAAFVHPRSGLAAREGLGLLNAPGTVDAGYRGEVRVCLVNHDPDRTIVVRRGDRIAQLVVQRVESVRFRVRDTLADLPASSRGGDGFGSTGVAATGYRQDTGSGADRPSRDGGHGGGVDQDESIPARRSGPEPGEVAW